MINKVFNAIKTACSWVGYDGLLHLGISFAVIVLLGWVMPVWVPVLAAVLAGLGKELYDLIKVGASSYDWKHSLHDLACDGVGIIAGALLCVLYIYARR